MQNPVAETMHHVRRQKEVTARVKHVTSLRRGISGDMERRVIRKLEKPSTPAEENSAQRPGL